MVENDGRDAPEENIEQAWQGHQDEKNEFGLGILIREVKKTSLVQGFSLELGFILKILMTRMKTDL